MQILAASGNNCSGTFSSCLAPSSSVQQAEDDPNAVRFERNLIYLGAPLQVVECQMCGKKDLIGGAGGFEPREILSKLCWPDTGESYPEKTLIHQGQAATPSQGLAIFAAHQIQVMNLFHLQRFPAGDDNVAIDGGEVNGIGMYVSVMRALNLNIDTAAGVGQGNRVALIESRDPDLISQLKDMIRMGTVRLGTGNDTVINVTGKACPGILFLEHAPLPQ